MQTIVYAWRVPMDAISMSCSRLNTVAKVPVNNKYKDIIGSMKIELFLGQSTTMSVHDKYITGKNSANDRGY